MQLWVNYSAHLFSLVRKDVTAFSAQEWIKGTLGANSTHKSDH